MSSNTVTWQQLVELLQSRERGETDFTLVDIREEYELFHGFIPGAINLPLSTFEPDALSGEVIVYCQAGVRSEHLLHELTAQGISGVKHYGGGYIDWVARSAPDG
jgi:adenylyltransferase/sulfurtransferase